VQSVLGPELARSTKTVYDVAHNVAKREEHSSGMVCVHRKGATRAFPPGHPEIPAAYAESGQPVFIPGSMGTASYVLAGRQAAMDRSFGTTCHGAGRRMSRTAVRKAIDPGQLRRRLEAAGIVVRALSARGLAEEAPEAYKDVDRVVEIVERAGLAARVARLRPVGVVKG
jgi:tRNA-splicing ligase RtcB